MRVQIGLGGERSVLGCRYTGIVILTSLPRTKTNPQAATVHSASQLHRARERSQNKNKSRYLGYEVLPLGSAVVRYPCAKSFFRGIIIIMASHSAHTPRG